MCFVSHRWAQSITNTHAHGLGAGVTGDGEGLNAALVDTALDQEEAVHTPGGTPRVGNEPVVNVVL